MKKLALTAAILMSATAALAQSASEKTGVNSALGVAPTTEDFVMKASASDMFEIESSKVAQQKGDDAVKKFAQQMITDHEKASSELKAMVSSAKVKATPATAMTEDMKENFNELSKLQGADFNEEYIDDQVEAHEDAVDLFKRYSEEGENADLKAFAAKTLPTLEHHYKMVQDMDKD